MTDQEYMLLGIALYKAQKIEFAIYGVLTHLRKEEDIVSNNRIRNLTPRKFLSNDLEDKKLRMMTLGQLNKELPDELGLDTN